MDAKCTHTPTCPACLSRNAAEIALEAYKAGRISADEYMSVLELHFRTMGLDR